MSEAKPSRRRKLYNEFLKESAIHGVRLLLYYTPFKYARYLWKILIVSIIIWTQYIIMNLIMQYIDQPTEVRMGTNRVHISSSPFPAFGVCNGNKFSRKKLKLFTERVFEAQQRFKPFYLAQTPEEMYQNLLYLDDFYITPYEKHKANETTLAKLDHLLTYMYNNSQYPIRDLLRGLGPDCDEIVIKGIVYGIPVNISDYFRKRLTTTGVCCMFNYKRESTILSYKDRDAENRFIRDNEPVQFQANSILNSIQFVLRTDPEDFTIRDIDIESFWVTVFPQNDYARIQSNHIGELLINYYSIVEIPIQPEFYESSDRVRQFKPNVRHCYFPDEGQKLLNRSFYSIDECLLLCRSESMLRHCGCVSPPMISTENVTYCNFVDLPCLRQWNAIWYDWNYFGHADTKDDDEDEPSSASQCPHCLPTCDGIKFRIYLNEMTMRRAYGGAYSHGLLKGLDDTKPLAIIKLFFKARFAQATETDIIGDWVVLLNRFGGIMGLMYGFSIITVIEIVYFCTGKFFTFSWNDWRENMHRKISTTSATTRNIKVDDKEPPPTYSLYWNELIPKHRYNMQYFRYHPRSTQD